MGTTIDESGLCYLQTTINGISRTLLLDNGANVSLIKAYCLSNERIIKNRVLNINGVCGSIQAKGNAKIRMRLGDTVIDHEFTVLDHFKTNADGILGTDFFTRFQACINYRTGRFSFQNGTESVDFELEGKVKRRLTIPPRCETIINCAVTGKGEYVVVNQELCEGVLVASTVGCIRNGKLPVRIMNTSAEEVQLRNFSPTLRKLEDFDMVNLQKPKLTADKARRILELIDLSHLQGSEYEQIQQICTKYFDVFHHPDDPLGVTNLYKESIKVNKGARPAYRKQYRTPHSQKDIIREEVKKLLDADIIEPAKSPWSAPILLVPKKTDVNGEKKWRIVIDYRELNERIVADKFPLPNITEILDSLSGATMFTHLDLSAGYYQVELEDDSRPCTAFVTDSGQWQLKRLPMGLKISPSVFSRLMTIALSGLSPEACFVYLDDIIVHGRNMDDHNRNLIKVMERLRAVNLKLNPKKCEFFKKALLYLGHKISEKGILPDPEKTRVLKEWPKPTNTDEVKRFVAFANYYRRFIKNFAEIVHPLNQLTRKEVLFEWTTGCDRAFNQLKSELSQPPVLQFPNFGKDNKFCLRTDASKIALGAVLSDEGDRPVAYASRPLNKAEINYPIIELELLSIVWAVQHFRPYLMGKTFDILTDHRPLVYLFGMDEPSSRLTKFRLKLAEFDFNIKHVKGRQNVTADALSRIIITSKELKDLENKPNVMAITRSHNKREGLEVLKKPCDAVEIVATEENCCKGPEFERNQNIIIVPISKGEGRARADTLNKLGRLIDRNEIDKVAIMKTPMTEQLIKQLQRITISAKLLLIKGAKRIEQKDTQTMIINEHHMSKCSGHFGSKKMFESIRRKYFWPTMRADIEAYISKCVYCQKNKHGKMNKQPMMITTAATKPMELVELDIMGPLPQDRKDNKYILSMHCRFSRYIVAAVLPNKTAEAVATAFVKEWILKYGVPKAILTDRGTEFTAQFFEAVCHGLGVSRLRSTAYHHETLGLTENSHKHLGEFLRVYTEGGKDEWSELIPFWCFSYNVTPHVTTGYAPYDLVFGKECRVPHDLTATEDPEEASQFGEEEYLTRLKERLKLAYQDVTKLDYKNKIKRKISYDKNVYNQKLNAGDLVLVKKEIGNKLANLYEGPFKILECKQPNVIINRYGVIDEIHMNRVKLFV